MLNHISQKVGHTKNEAEKCQLELNMLWFCELCAEKIVCGRKNSFGEEILEPEDVGTTNKLCNGFKL